MADYTELYGDGGLDAPDRPMYIYLYPNTDSEYNNCMKGNDIVDAVYDAQTQLFNGGSVDLYKLKRYESGYPELTTNDDLVTDFRSWLKNEDGYSNGAGYNLYGAKGIHLLVHGFSCSTSTAGGEFADNCDSPSAFKRGVIAYTGTCGDTGLRKNSAIQEPVHGFIEFRYDQVYNMTTYDPSSDYPNTGKEHELGAIRDYRISPMLTYHTNEYTNAGDCDGDGTGATGYTTNLTGCTKSAVKKTGNRTC